jgi:phytase-like protein
MACSPLAAADIQARFLYSDDTLLRIGPYAFEGGKTLNLTVGIGSAAFRHPNDPPNVIWTLGDRGPNIACSEMKEIAGVELAACKEVKNGRVYPTPSYAPSIYRVLIKENSFQVTDVITLKDGDGRPLSGLLNPLKTAATDTGLDGSGKPLPYDLNGIDVEAIVRLADGTFWIGEENGPSLSHFSADGRLLVRHVPKGTEGEFAGARYDVEGTLPAILAKRAVNRGIESLAISPDQRFLYTLMQNPLAQSGHGRLPEGEELTPAQDRARDDADRGRIRLHARRSQELPPRSLRQAERSAHQRDDGNRARSADRAGAHRADHQAARGRSCRRHQYREQ